MGKRKGWNMSHNHGPKIASNGLQICLDTLNHKSWPGSGTTWKNLVDKSDYTTDLGNPSWANNVTAITVMLWFEKTAVSPEYATHPVNKWNSSYANNASFILYHFGNYLGNYPASDGCLGWYGNVTPQNGSGWTAITAGTEQLTIGKKYHIVLQYNNTSGGQMWRNGEKVGGRTAGGYNGLGQTSINSTTSNLYIQDGPVAGTYQRVHQISFYNRELSDDEILRIYLSTKGRYGL
jgi:hypothetical protein